MKKTKISRDVIEKKFEDFKIVVQNKHSEILKEKNKYFLYDGSSIWEKYEKKKMLLFCIHCTKLRS